MTMSPKAMSKRVFGIGIIATGLLILAIALIIGLEFPKYVYRRNLNNVCIVDKKHEKYKIWNHDSLRDKYNRIYYWQLKNKAEFLSGRALPKFEEKGPYVYKEFQEKMSVRFVSHTAQFYVRREQTYDAERTLSECGKMCSQDEEITLVNPNYLRMIAEYGDDVTYTQHRIPVIMRETLEQITRLHGHSDGFNHTLFLLGKTSNDIDTWVTELQYPPGFRRLSFAHWLSAGDTDAKRTVISQRGNKNFSLVESHGLYEALLNEDLLGASKTALTNRTFQLECELLAGVTKAFNVTYEIMPRTGGTDSSCSFQNYQNKPCGLLVCLKHYQELKQLGKEAEMANLTYKIAQYLCTNQSFSCFDISDNIQLRMTYLDVMSDYIFTHLAQFIFYKSVIVVDEDIVATKRQEEWTLGYYLGNSSTGEYPGNEFVPGFLEHVPVKTEVSSRTNHVTLNNCYDSIEANTNFMWKAYDHKLHSTQTQFPSATLNERQVLSHFLNFQPVKNLSACAEYTLPEEWYYIFLPEFWRRFTFRKSGERPGLYGVPLERLVLNSSNFVVDGSFILEPGIQDMTGTLHYMSWRSLPHFLFSPPGLPSLYEMSPEESKHGSFMDVELLSGEVWRRTLRYQHNIGIRSNYTRMRRNPPLDINITDSPIPVYWVETNLEYNMDGLNDYKDRIGNLMNTSCGGLVGLSVVAALVICFGFIAATVTVRGGRIAPIDVEEHSLG